MASIFLKKKLLCAINRFWNTAIWNVFVFMGQSANFKSNAHWVSSLRQTVFFWWNDAHLEHEVQQECKLQSSILLKTSRVYCSKPQDKTGSFQSQHSLGCICKFTIYNFFLSSSPLKVIFCSCRPKQQTLRQSEIY